MEQGRIFISYRRSDSQPITDRLYEHLTVRTGGDLIFKDVEDILGGQDFKEVIVKEIGRSDTVLAVIGPTWATVKDKGGHPRLNDPSDVVRIELETAIQGDKRIVPVLVAGATMPDRSTLPESLRKVCSRHALLLRDDPDFRNDIAKIAREIGLPDESEQSSDNLVRKRLSHANVLALGLCLLTAWLHLEFDGIDNVARWMTFITILAFYLPILGTILLFPISRETRPRSGPTPPRASMAVTRKKTVITLAVGLFVVPVLLYSLTESLNVANKNMRILAATTFVVLAGITIRALYLNSRRRGDSEADS